MSETNKRFLRPFDRTPALVALVALAALAAPITGWLSGCHAPLDLRFIGMPDLRPPILQSVAGGEAGSLVLTFDSVVTAPQRYLVFDPPRRVDRVEDATETVRIHFADEARPGHEYRVEIVVEDARHNSSRYILPFFGHNSRVPGVIINEFSVVHSTNHRERVELLITEAGNLGGLALFYGSHLEYDQRLVFPEHEVEEGDFVVVHFRPEGVPEEVDETTDKTASTARLALATAFDYWIPEGTGLSTTNGVLTLAETPRGPIIDAVIYSNRSDDADDRYRGFGTSRMMNRVDHIGDAAAWVGRELLLMPEDAVNPARSTATRSINRRGGEPNSLSKADWYIVPTSKQSFGLPNSALEY